MSFTHTERTSPKTRKIVATHGSYTDTFEVPNHFDVLYVPEPGKQNADGGVHLTHYDRANLMSYIWDGHADHIEVSHGGYAEPVIAHIFIDPDIIEEVVTTHYDGGDNHTRDILHIFERHVLPEEYDEEEDEEEADPAVCPECGSAPASATQTSESVSTILGFGGGFIHVEHKEHFEDGNFVLLCAEGHEYPVPEGVEVMW